MPTQTLINATNIVSQSSNPSIILDPVKNVAKSVATLPAIATNITAWPMDNVFKEAQKLAAKTGKSSEFVFDVATFGDNYLRAMVKSSGQAATNVMLGKNPLQFVAMPLAAAIREARERHITNAKPLPADVKMCLSRIYSSEVLDRARYVIGGVEITLPNGIGKTTRLFGDQFAVVVDDVIVFNTDPGGFWNNPFWWGHEVEHVRQYMQLGIEDFAFKYVRNFRGDIEGPADYQGDIALIWAKNNHSIQNMNLSSIASNSYAEAFSTSEPLLPDSYIQNVVPQTPVDPAIIRLFFPGDSPALEYYGTKSGKIIVVDNIRKAWMQIGWAIPPDIQGPSWIYFIPGRCSYDVFSNGSVVQRYSMPYGQNGPIGPAVQVGYAARLQ